MKKLIFISIVAIFMATTAVAGNTNNHYKNPGDGNKVSTTLRCNKEKGARPKTYTTKSKSTVKKSFTKKHYRHMKKRR